MSDLSYMDKLNIQLRENALNKERAADAFEDAGIDTEFTMGDAIELFIETHGLYDFDDPTLRNQFHDAMHIAGLAHNASAHGEAIAGVTEQTLLREPYNGDLNEQLEKARQSNRPVMQQIVGSRSFNPAGHEDFERPAPAGDYASAKKLAKQRLEFVKSTAEFPEKDVEDAYQRALETDEFFKGVMGGRAVYQLSMQELMDTPIAFFGIQKAGADDELILEDIPKETREAVLADLEDQNITIYKIGEARTVAELQQLGLEQPDPSGQHLEL
jgi:hypothetical protein